MRGGRGGLFIFPLPYLLQLMSTYPRPMRLSSNFHTKNPSALSKFQFVADLHAYNTRVPLTSWSVEQSFKLNIPLPPSHYDTNGMNSNACFTVIFDQCVGLQRTICSKGLWLLLIRVLFLLLYMSSGSLNWSIFEYLYFCFYEHLIFPYH